MEQLVFCSQRQVAHEAGAFLNERLLADVEKGSPSKKKGTSIINMILIMMIYPQPIRRHCHPQYTFITVTPVSYLRSLVVRAVHRHRTGVGSIPAGGHYS